MKRLFLLLPLLFFFTNSFSQSAPIESWLIHMPFSNAISVAVANNRVYCANKLGLHYYDKNDNSLNQLSKTNGLSDIDISKIKYHAQTNCLVVAYKNANIDLIKENKIINISDILRSNVSTTKKINNIDFYLNYAYLSCNFGIVILDLDKEEIKDTYFIGEEGNQIEVIDIAISKDTLFAATKSGISFALLNNPNLNTYENWEKLTSPHTSLLNINAMTYINGKLIINNHTSEYKKDTLYCYSNSKWVISDSTNYSDKTSIETKYDKLIITGDGYVDLHDNKLNRIRHIYNYFPKNANPIEADIETNNDIWIADEKLGLIHNYTDAFKYEILTPSGPPTHKAGGLKFTNETLYAGTGGKEGTWANLFTRDGFYTYSNQKWTVYNKENYITLDSILDIIHLSSVPNEPQHIYACSWGNGVLEINNGKIINLFNNTNSSLQSIDNLGNIIKVYDLVFDDIGNCWFTNSYVRNSLSVKKPDNTWKSFDLSEHTQYGVVSNIIIDQNYSKWMILSQGSGILVFNDNQTIDDTSDDLTKRLTNTPGNGGLPSSEIFSIAIDSKNHIWVGTDKGIAIFYNPDLVFNDQGFDAEQTIVQKDGYNQYLLEFESVTSITVDGANRKWCGTKNGGVFLISEDGTEEIHHFNTTNSPLISNNIESIAINDKTGEVFFATDKGICSYKGTATKGETIQGDITIYPNPVKPEYKGKIAIRGLVDNANVKITDISGEVVFETTAYGGQAIWNGCDFTGNRVNTGVYIVFSTSSDGKETITSKILFIN